MPWRAYQRQRVNITVWGINYDPEPTGIGPFNTDLCTYLAEQGHAVTMISTFPYYPWWKKPKEADGKWVEEHFIRGVRVLRCWHWVPAKPSTLKRLLHELSFVYSSTLTALFAPKADVYIVVSPPLFLGFGAFLVKLLRRGALVYHVQDLQPDAALGLGMIKPGPAVKMLYRLEKFNYTTADLVSGISQGMLDAFASKGVPSAKIVYFPNWIPDSSKPKLPADGVSFRAANNIPRDAALIAYSGNVGMKQGLEVVVEAGLLAKAAGKRKMLWAICGEGAAKPLLSESIARQQPGNVVLFPLQPDGLYHSLLLESDISLITQQKGTGQFFFPSKLLSILQYGRPVLAVADESSELARAVHQGQFGIVVPPGDAEALLAAADRMLSADDAQKQTWARNGRAWVDQFRRSRVLSDFQTRLKRLVAAQGSS